MLFCGNVDHGIFLKKILVWKIEIDSNQPPKPIGSAKKSRSGADSDVMMSLFLTTLSLP